VTSSHDVVVVGAGPAGTATAIALADAGLDVALIDKATFPRDKTCGDGLTTLALRELEALGLTPSTVPSWTPVDVAHLHSPGHRTVTMPLPPGPGWHAAIARRLELDAALVDLAESRGVDVRLGHALTAASMTLDGVEVHADALGPMRARWVVGADGVWSPLRKALGLSERGYRGEWHGFRQYLHTTAPAARDLHVWFEPDLLPGYAWSFPLPDGGANVGFGVLRGARLDGKAMAAVWVDLLARPALREVLGPDAAPEGPHRAWPIPAKVTRSILGAGRVLFVGDAARATDLFTGEGIGQALLTGRLAAEAIASRPGSRPDQVVARYAASVTDHLAPDHRMATALSWMMRDRRVAEAAIGVVGTNDWTRRNVGRWLFEDSPRGIALTPRRWRRGVLSGPPAYRSTAASRPTSTAGDQRH
jgi:menaquinone-9 beta-reductase